MGGIPTPLHASPCSFANRTQYIMALLMTRFLCTAVESCLMINTYKFKSVYNHLQLSEDLHTSRSPPPLFPLQGVKTPNMNEAGGKKCSSASRGLFIPLCRLCGNWNIPPQAASWTVTRRKRERRVSCRAGVMIVAAGEQGPCHSVLFDWAADDSPRCLAV